MAWRSVRRALVVLGCLSAIIGANRSFGEPPAKPVQPAASDATEPASRPLRVLAKDRDGKPIAGAQVQTSVLISGKSGSKAVSTFQTDREGLVVVRLPPGDVTYFGVFARAAGYVYAGASWHSREGVARIPPEIEFVMDPATTIGGIVRDEQSRPIAGVKVTVSGQEKLPGGVRFNMANDKVQTDAQGKWTSRFFPKLSSGLRASLQFEHPDYASPSPVRIGELPMESLWARTAVTTMRKGVVVAGVVMDRDRQPVAGATVAQVPNIERFEGPQVKTDENGQFRFPRCEPGVYFLAAAVPGGDMVWRRVTVDAKQCWWELTLAEVEAIRLRVFDRDGKPVPEVSIGYGFPLGKPRVLLMQWASRTDAEGRWNGAWLPNEPIELNIFKRGYLPLRQPMTAGPQEQAVTLEKNTVGPVWSIAGRVVDGDTKAPVNRFQVVEGYAFGKANRLVTWHAETLIANARGDYRVQWDNSGDSARVVWIEADGYFPSQKRWLTMNESRVTFDVELARGPAVSGVVRAADGSPLADADVILSNRQRRIRLDNGRHFNRDKSVNVRTASDGRFALSPQQDPYALLVLHDRGCALAEAGTKEITVQPWARVEGTLRIGDRPGAGEEISLSYGDRRPHAESPSAAIRQAAGTIDYSYRTPTDDQGRFVFEYVWPGPVILIHSVSVARKNTRPPTASSRVVHLVMSPGQTFHWRLDGTGRAVTGRAVLAGRDSSEFDFTGSVIRTGRLLPDIPWPEDLQGTLPLPDPDAQREDRERWWRAREVWQTRWLESEAGRAYHGDRTTAVWADIQQDGSFRLVDVPPGQYRLWSVINPPEERLNPQSTRSVGELDHVFVLTDAAGQSGKEPLDLGTLPLIPPDDRR